MLAVIPSPPTNALHLGPLQLRAYGLMIALGVIGTATRTSSLGDRRSRRTGTALRKEHDRARTWSSVLGALRCASHGIRIHRCVVAVPVRSTCSTSAPQPDHVGRLQLGQTHLPAHTPQGIEDSVRQIRRGYPQGYIGGCECVRFGAGVVFGLAGVGGSLLGSHLNKAANPDLLLLAFSGLMLIAADALWRRVRRTAGPTAARTPVAARSVGAAAAPTTTPSSRSNRSPLRRLPSRARSSGS